MLDNVKRFDMAKKPKRQLLRPLIWSLCFPSVLSHKCKITKINMNGIKPPYLLLANHNAFMDFKVLTKAIFPHRANYVIAIDGFIKREWLLRRVGGICKRKFTNDITLIKQLKRVISNKDIAVIYPEARYSLCGTNSILPDSLSKLAKFLNVPIVTLICNGHHINSPFWNTPKDRKVKGLTATLKCIANAEDIATLSNEDIMSKINREFVYDDFKWQRDNNIKVTYKNRACGLDKVLYMCPNCKTEYEMESFESTLRCKHCKKEWEMTEYGELSAKDGKTEFKHIPDWYEYERECVRKEIESGKYYFESDVHIDALPNSKGYIHLGKGKLIHNMDGFKLTGNDGNSNFEIILNSKNTYSVHIEYNYLNKYGDCIDLNTLNDTLYVYPENKKSSVTKISLATEELYKYLNKKH